MTLEDYSLTAFAALNGVRVVAYVPQILCVFRDRSGAVSASLMTWGIFLLANLATVTYASVTGDRVIAGIFALNAIGCLIIFLLIVEKRISHAMRRTGVTDRSTPTSRVAAIAHSAKILLLTTIQRNDIDRLAARHANGHWSDTTEREINNELEAFWCGRLYR